MKFQLSTRIKLCLQKRTPLKQQDAIKIFEDKKVSTIWDGKQEQWYFSIVDVIAVLTDSPNLQVSWEDDEEKFKA